MLASLFFFLKESCSHSGQRDLLLLHFLQRERQHWWIFFLAMEEEADIKIRSWRVFKFKISLRCTYILIMLCTHNSMSDIVLVRFYWVLFLNYPHNVWLVWSWIMNWPSVFLSLQISHFSGSSSTQSPGGAEKCRSCFPAMFAMLPSCHTPSTLWWCTVFNSHAALFVSPILPHLLRMNYKNVIPIPNLKNAICILWPL